MLRYIENKEIDRIKWDTTIEEAKNGLIYVYSWWLDSVSVHWDALVYGDYEIVMPLIWNKKWGLKSIYPPFEVQQLGIFFKKTLHQAQFDQFFEAIPKEFQQINLTLNTQNNFKTPKYTRWQANNYILDLNKPYNNLRKGYNSNTKRNIKKAKNLILQNKGEWTATQCIALFKEQKAHELKMDEAYYQRMEVVMKTSIMHNKGAIWGIIDEKGMVHAIAFFAFSHNRLYNLMPATRIEGKKSGAMFFLLDQLIQKHAETSNTLDFEGSMAEGVARFYRGFGAIVEHYWHIGHNRMSWYHKGAYRAVKWLR